MAQFYVDAICTPEGERANLKFRQLALRRVESPSKGSWRFQKPRAPMSNNVQHLAQRVPRNLFRRIRTKKVPLHKGSSWVLKYSNAPRETFQSHFSFSQLKRLGRNTKCFNSLDCPG